MQYPGYWVSGDDKQIVITRYKFDDTELSEASGWKESHQNEDESQPHGFVRWDDALQNIEQRLNGDIACPPIFNDDDDDG